MADKPVIFHPRRRTSDDSYVSICLSCFATVARTKAEAALEKLEKSHICNSYLLTERGYSCGPHLNSPETQPRAR